MPNNDLPYSTDCSRGAGERNHSVPVKPFSSQQVWLQQDFLSWFRCRLHRKLILILLAGFSWIGTTSLSAQGSITGTLFRDFNADGVRQGSNRLTDTYYEPGVAGVTIRAYDSDDPVATPSGTATSDNDGNFTITGLVGGKFYRVECVNLPAGLQPGAAGGTTVQYAVAATTPVPLSVGLNSAGDFCSSNPDLFTSCYVAGDPLASGNNSANEAAIIRFPFNASGSKGAGGTEPTLLATAGQVGSTWGMAYLRDKKTVLAASVVKRHTGLGPGETGGRIYAIYENGTVGKWTDLVSDHSISVGTIPSNAARGLPADKTQNSYDIWAFTNVGKVGLGDMDVSDDLQKVYVVNLFDRKVYAVPVQSNGSAGTPSALPDFPDPACPNGVARPWALKYKDGALYLGVICTGENSGGTDADLRLYVYKYDVASGSWNSTPIFSISNMGWEKGLPLNLVSGPRKWHRWTDAYSDFTNRGFISAHEQPMLTDIEFDRDGSLHLVLADRNGFQTGHRNEQPLATRDINQLTTCVVGGELLRTWYNPATGMYALESAGVAGPYTSSGTGTTNAGPGGPTAPQGPGGGDFYWSDYNTNFNHSETSMGSTFHCAGSNLIVSTNIDPVQNQVDAGGLLRFNILNGSSTLPYQLYQDAGNNAFTFGKGVGLGDIDGYSTAALIEIGNLVWEDSDNDGIQDPGEPGLANVTLELWTDTDNNGTADT